MLFVDYKKRKIRLETERWQHIIKNHPEIENAQDFVKDTLSDPDIIQSGNNNELLAIKQYRKTPVSHYKYCVVIYKVLKDDGFVITGFFTRRPSFKRKLLWKKQ